MLIRTMLIAVALTFGSVAARAENASSLEGAYANLAVAKVNGGHDSSAPQLSGYDVVALQGRLGYRFNKWLGAEGEAGVGLGSDTDQLGVRIRKSLRAEAAAYVVGYVPLDEQTDLIGRVGYGRTWLKESFPDVMAPNSRTFHEDSINIGVGLHHRLDAANGVRFDLTRKEFTRDGMPAATAWSVGYVRRF